MADQRTMAELLRAPTEGYAEAIVVPPILAEHFELKHSLINMMTSDQFFRLEKDNPHDHTGIPSVARKRTPAFYSHLAWDRYKDLLRACPHHGFTELHQLNTFCNALNPADQHSLNAAAVAICWKDVLKDSETYSCSQSANECCNYRHDGYSQTISSNRPLAFVKAVEEICVTCDGAHPYYQCLAAGGNTFPELRDNIQGYVSAAAVIYNQGNSVYRPPEQSYQAPTQQNQIVPLNELEKVKRTNEANMKAMQTQINIVKNELRNEMKNSIQASRCNQTNEIKNMMASLFQMNSASTSGSGSFPSNTVANPKGELKAITTRSDIVLDGPIVPIPPPFINPEVDECVEETLTDPDLSEYTIKYQKMLKALLSNKEKLQELANTPLNENCSAVILKKLPEKLRDLGKFLIPCGFSKLKCKALADLGASINLMPLSVWKKNCKRCLRFGWKFTFLAYFVIFDYESDPRVSFILGRPFLRTARALIDVHGEEMILRDGDERLTLNMRHDTSSYSNQPQKESINLINVFNDLEDFLEDLFSTNQPSGNPTFLSHSKLTSPEFDVESDLKEIEFLFHQDIDSSLKDSIDQSNLANPADNFVNSMPEMFTDEHAPDYSSHSIFDKYDDVLFEVESDTKNVYDDPFDSKGEKIKESKLLIDELDLPCDFLPPSEYDLFISEDFSRVDAFSSTNNEDKVFNPGILIQENPFEIITRVVQDKKLATSNASLMLEDSDPPLYEPIFFKKVPRLSIREPSRRTKNDSVKLEVKAKQGLFGNPKSSYVEFVSFSLVKENLKKDKIRSKLDKNGKRAARRWLETEPPHSITTWDDLVSKFINEFFPPSRTKNLRNEISNFQQKFDESFHEAWERYKDLLCACPRYGFTELHQLNTFYNALNPADQDSLNAAAGGNLLEKSPQDALTIIENKSKVHNSRSKPIASPVNACDNHSSSELAKLTHAVNQQTSAVTTAMTAMLKQFQSNPSPAQVKAVEEIYVTCEGSHPYYKCLAAGGNTFPEYRDNIQGYVSAATGNNNQGNLGYRPQGVANQMRPPEQPYQATQSNQNFHFNELEKIKRMNDVSLKAMQNQIDMVKNKLRNEMKTSIQTSLSNQTNKIINMMTSLLQMNTASTSGSGTLLGNTIANPKGELKAITTHSGLVTEGPTIPNPPKSVNLEEDGCVEETYTDPDQAEYTIKVPPPPPVQKPKPPIQRNFVLHTSDSLPPHIPHIPKLNCKALADLVASINLMPLSVWKKLGLPDLIPTQMTLELANRAICTPDGIARDVFVPVGKFTFPADFVVVDYESDHRVPLILGRPFLRTARALIDVHGKEMILRDGDDRLTLNMKHDTASYSNHPRRESVNLINIFNLSSEDCLKDLVSHKQSGNPTFLLHKEIASPEVIYEFHDSKGCTFLSEELPDIDSFNETHPYFDDDPLSGSTTYSANSLLKEFADELALISYPPDYDDNRAFSYASWLFEDFDPPFYELLVFKEVPNSMRLLPFSSENEKKVFKPGTYTLKKFHCCFLSELSHPELALYGYSCLYKSSPLGVRDEEVTKRFHGAFSGGFSAGYFNIMGSKEG
uniref:Reverse transcriptase domain-containing protein n=1 Tax=Tanacetum cinerariifolium TaxID=118510 RepID=A0A6L2M2S0_TANCI|nr:hypothetical protein [Tanacetum cinerariifolium]